MDNIQNSEKNKKRRHRKPKNMSNSNNKSFDGLSKSKLIKRTNCPEAPYNTTQFLIDEHASDENVSTSMNGELSSNTSSEFNDSTFEYLVNDFNNVYGEVHYSDLNKKSKSDLIDYCFSLEQTIESLKNQIQTIKNVQSN